MLNVTETTCHSFLFRATEPGITDRFSDRFGYRRGWTTQEVRTGAIWWFTQGIRVWFLPRYVSRRRHSVSRTYYLAMALLSFLSTNMARASPALYISRDRLFGRNQGTLTPEAWPGTETIDLQKTMIHRAHIPLLRIFDLPSTSIRSSLPSSSDSAFKTEVVLKPSRKKRTLLSQRSSPLLDDWAL